MNKKLVGSVIAIVAVVALVTVIMITRPDDTTDNSNKSTSSSSSTDNNMDMPASNSGDNSNETATETTQVAIEDFAFAPGTIKVKKGATVTWTNKDSAAHTVTGTGGAKMSSGTMEQGKTYSFTFDETGTFAYKCDFHPSMTAEVIVE